MAALTLIIGNKNYSSWSLRPWLLLKQLGIPFDEVRIPLYRSESKPLLEQWSPSGLVPVLHQDDVVVWDSLAICEYINESYPELMVWPQSRSSRAHARAISAEMHSGFGALRQSMPMNCREEHPGEGVNAESANDIARIHSIWRECRAAHESQGPFLFGEFTAADAMYAPVVLRFKIYGVTLDPVTKAYAEAILGLPAMAEWVQAGKAETERIEKFDHSSALA